MSFSVLFEETGEEREVVTWCRRCFKTEPEEDEINIVSVRGMGHDSADHGLTACGIDATANNDWWHRL